MRNLLLWTNMYPTSLAPYYGTFVRSTEQAWRKALGGDNVQLVAIDEKPVSRFNKVVLYSGLMFRCLFSLFNKPSGTLLEVHYPVYFLPILCLAKIFGNKKYIILRFHGSDLQKLVASRLFTTLFRCIKNDVSLYVVPSDYYRERVSSQLNISMDSVVKVYPDCVTGEGFSSSNNQKSVTDGAFFHIGFVSRLEPLKNCQELIEAFAKLNIPSAHLTIVGDGSQRQSLEALVQQLSLSSQVTFKGAVARQHLPEIMEKFSVFIFPSIAETESFGLVALEALACGTPVIANQQLKAAEEYLAEGENGFFYSDGANGLCRAIEAFYALPDVTKAELSLQAKNVQQKFNYDEVFTAGVEKILARANS